MKKQLAPFELATDSLHFKTEGKTSLPRVIFLPILVVIVFLILFVRLFHLTIVKGNFYKASAQDNRINEVIYPAKRGALKDRHGEPVAESINDGDQNSVKWKRQYKDNLAFSHLLGYLQIASKTDMKEDLCETHLMLGDSVGKGGVEKIFECPLRGRPGKKLIEVDATGKTIKTLNILPEKTGTDITLSLDSKLQQTAYDVVSQNRLSSNVELDLREKPVSIIATIPKTGEILLLYSNPSFDLTAFGSDQKAVSNYLKDKKQPLFNRVTSGIYPPGSTFKPVVAAAALEEDKIDENFTVEDTGTIKAGPSTFGNWYFLQYGRLDGTVNVVKALKRSNDIFFYRVGEKLGAPDLKRWAARFGLGRPTGSSLNEVEGLLPSAFWKKQTLGEKWYLGDTYNLSIGQGYLLTTPLQLHTALSSFANGGKLCTPKLLRAGKNADHPLLKKELETECKPLGLKTETLALVREGMKQACETGGTGWPFFNFIVNRINSNKNTNIRESSDGNTSGVAPVDSPEVEEERISVGCKTGTAEDPGEPPHAWFTVFAPFERPEIALTVMVENSGEGSSVAAPIAKEILKSYFENKN